MSHPWFVTRPSCAERLVFMLSVHLWRTKDKKHLLTNKVTGVSQVCRECVNYAVRVQWQNKAKNEHKSSESITGADAYYKKYAPGFFDSSFISVTRRLRNKTTKITAQSAFLNKTVFSFNVFVSCNFVQIVIFYLFLFSCLCGCWPTSFPLLRVNKEHEVELDRNWSAIN